MVVLFVVITIILFLTIDYVIQRKKKVGLASQPHPGNIALSRVFSLLPSGVFLQPSYTWSKILDSGNLLVGIHPIIMGLIGNPDEIELLHPGERVKKGTTILKIHKGEKIIRVSAPLDGAITSLNNQVVEDSTMENLGQNWIYSIKPDNVSAEISQWMIAEKARDWITNRYSQMKKFFQENLSQNELGITMADGGDLPVGILGQFDNKIWQKFERKFLN